MGEVHGSAIKARYGESVSLTTTAKHLLFRPDYHEVKAWCASAYRVGIAPKLAAVVFYDASAESYIDYSAEAIDRNDSNVVTLSSMTSSDYLYLGVAAPTRGFYFNVVATNSTATTTGTIQYMYDIANSGNYWTLTGTVSAALTVGETLTGGTSGATGTVVYDDGSTYVVVKNVTGMFELAETASGASQNISAITAIAQTHTGNPYFTAVASGSDGTSGSTALDQDGLYSFTLPSVVSGAIVPDDVIIPNDTNVNLLRKGLYWYRYSVDKTLDSSVTAADIIPACADTNYGYAQAGIVENYSINTHLCGAFEFDHTGTGTLYLDWLRR